jgi:hypothetical protein
MADAFYDSLIKTADALITKRGRQVSIIHPTDATAPDPTKPWDGAVGQGAPLTNTTFAVFTQFDRKSVDGTQIKATDLKMIFTALKIVDFDISSRDVVQDTIYGKLAIIDVGLIQPGSTKVLYTLQVRRA